MCFFLAGHRESRDAYAVLASSPSSDDDDARHTKFFAVGGGGGGGGSRVFCVLSRISFFLSFSLARAHQATRSKVFLLVLSFLQFSNFFSHYTFRVSKERTLFELPPHQSSFFFATPPTHPSMKVRRCCSSIDFGPAFVSIIFSRSNLRRTRDSRSGWTERGSRERARGRRGCARFLRVFWVLFLRRKGEMRAF